MSGIPKPTNEDIAAADIVAAKQAEIMEVVIQSESFEIPCEPEPPKIPDTPADKATMDVVENFGPGALGGLAH